jgi:hypothetical protein
MLQICSFATAEQESASGCTQTDCTYYSCLDASKNCGPNGYPAGYGLKYCNAFLRNRDYFDEVGRKWTDCVRPALIAAMKNYESSMVTV